MNVRSSNFQISFSSNPRLFRSIYQQLYRSTQFLQNSKQRRASESTDIIFLPRFKLTCARQTDVHATNTRYPRFFIRDLPMTAITRGITMHADRFDFVRRNVISKAHLAGRAGTGLFDIMRSIECKLGVERKSSWAD